MLAAPEHHESQSDLLDRFFKTVFDVLPFVLYCLTTLENGSFTSCLVFGPNLRYPYQRSSPETIGFT